eukprot:Nk52_evm5s256 gene=Nk52_evmTU5s256
MRGAKHFLLIFATVTLLVPQGLGRDFELPVGFILPLSTQTILGEDIRVAISIAEDDIKSKTLIPPHVKLVTTPDEEFILDDQSRALVGLKHATTLVLKNDVAVLMGAWNSAVSTQVATYASSAGIVQISGASASPSLSQKKNYPSFVRTTPTSDARMKFQLKLCQMYGWTEVAVITTDDAFGRGAAKAFQDNAEDFGIVISIVETVPFNIALLGSQDSVQRGLKHVQGAESRVIFISAISGDAVEILKLAREIGITPGKYQFLSGDGWVFEGLNEIYDEPEELLGVVGVQSFIDTSHTEYQQYIEKFKLKQQAMYNRTKEVPELTSAFYYDAMILFADALNRTASRLSTFSIDIDCLRFSNTSNTPCLLSKAERNAIYQDSLSNNFTGVVEYLTFLPDESDTNEAGDVSFGAHSRFTQAMLLQEMYRASFRGVGNYIKLTSTGDIEGVYAVMNFQPASTLRTRNASSSVRKGAWVITGVGSAKEGQPIAFDPSRPKMQFSGSKFGSPATDHTVFQPFAPFDSCSVADNSEYSLFENMDYATSNFESGVTTILLFGGLIASSFAFGLAYAIFLLHGSTRSTGKGGEEDEKKHKDKETFYSLVSNNSNNAVLVILTIEYIFLLFVSLQTDISWLAEDGTENVVKSVFNLSLGNFLFFVNYVLIVILLLWCVYCIVYLFHLSSIMKRFYLGELFLYPSIFYLRIVGTIGLLPIVTSLLRLFNCSYISTNVIAVLVRPYCDQECFTTSHYILLSLSGVILTGFIPLNLLTAHIWQELTVASVRCNERAMRLKAVMKYSNSASSSGLVEKSALCLVYRREYILASQALYLALVSCIAFLKLYPYVFLLLVVLLLSARSAFHFFYFPENKVVNVVWVDSLIHCQTVAGVGSALICLATHFADVKQLWPLGLVFAWGLTVFSLWLFFIRACYKKHSATFYDIPLSQKIGKRSRKEKLSGHELQLIELVGEITKRSTDDHTEIPSDTTSITTVESNAGLSQKLHTHQCNLVKASLISYCGAINSHPSDEELLDDIVSFVLQLVQSLEKSFEKAVDAMENTDGNEWNNIMTGNSTQLDMETKLHTYRFLGNISGVMRTQGLRMRTPFLQSTPLDVLGDEDVNKQLIEQNQRVGRKSEHDPYRKVSLSRPSQVAPVLDIA